VTQPPKRETRIIRCPACQRYYRITSAAPAPGTRLRCTKCGEVFGLAERAVAKEASAAPTPAPAAAPIRAAKAAGATSPAPKAAAARPAPPRGRVLVATDGQDFQSLVAEVLGGAGYELQEARSGDEAWEAFGSWRPHVVLLDVALPGVPAFELCDRVRALPAASGTGLILIASVFQQTRYKRAPTSLYGADDYIEKHHIRDWLPDKVARLLPPGLAAPLPPPPPPPASRTTDAPAPPPRQHGLIGERERETLIREELYGPGAEDRRGMERLRENLRRYARIIVSDIALYNQELVEQGIREGTFSQLLKKEIEEGRRLYLTRVPPTARGTDHYEEAVRDFVAKRSGGHGGLPPRPRGRHERP
jgi:predicted Zn finger-like uncharacterized protein